MMLAVIILVVAVADRLVGEPPARFHPVVWFGRLVALLDRAWRYPKAVGALGAVSFPLVAAGVVWAAVVGATVVHPVAGGIVAAFVLFSSTSLRLLVETAREVVALSETDLSGAREALLALAGRDASELSPALVRSAATESAAENLADGLVGPLVAVSLAAVAVSLTGWSTPVVGAAVAAAWVKAVNTMDSMIGYRSKPVGWGAARLDDVVMWLPARLTALLISASAATPDPVLSGRRWARIPESPNAGWPMATLAAALQVRLEKPDTYTLNPVASLPTPAQANRGIGLVERAGWLTFGITAVITLV